MWVCSWALCFYPLICVSVPLLAPHGLGDRGSMGSLAVGRSRRLLGRRVKCSDPGCRLCPPQVGLCTWQVASRGTQPPSSESRRPATTWPLCGVAGPRPATPSVSSLNGSNGSAHLLESAEGAHPRLLTPVRLLIVLLLLMGINLLILLNVLTQNISSFSRLQQVHRQVEPQIEL